MPRAKVAWAIIRETFSRWIDDKALRLGAALAYYALFAIAPLVIIAIAVAGSLFGRDAAQGEIVRQLQGIMGADVALAVQTLVERAAQPHAGVLPTIVGVVMVLVASTGLFVELQDALNTIWGVKPRRGNVVLELLRERLLSFAMVLGIGFLLLVSLLVSAAISAMSAWVGFHGLELQLANVSVSFAAEALLFGAIFKVLPDTKVAWKDVWIGALVTSALFTLGKALIALYLAKSGVASSYGAAGSFVLLLVWLYYSAQILVLGAEFTHAIATHVPSHAAARPPVGTRTRARLPLRVSRSASRRPFLGPLWDRVLLRLSARKKGAGVS